MKIINQVNFLWPVRWMHRCEKPHLRSCRYHLFDGSLDEGAECEWQEKRLKVLAGSLTSFLKSFQLNALLYLSLSNKLASPNNLLLEVIGKFLNNTASKCVLSKVNNGGDFTGFLSKSTLARQIYFGALLRAETAIIANREQYIIF